MARVNPSAVAGSRAVLAYLAVEPGAGLRQGLFAQGNLATGSLRSLAVPLNAVRTDKPLPYVQWINKGQVAHASVTLGARGEAAGVTMVGVAGVAENSEVLNGTVGPVREGTLVTRRGAK